MSRNYLILILVLVALLQTSRASGETILIATAANFSPAAREIIQRFNATTPHHAKLISASNGKLFAQIVNGAPYDVLLAADKKNPTRLAVSHHAFAESQFTYAQGRLALFINDPAIIQENSKKNTQESDSDLIKKVINRWLTSSDKKMAIANPIIAPYGRAAIETLISINLYQAVKSRLVQAENISQTHQFVSTGNAALGFIALSHVYHLTAKTIVIPKKLHQPIEQDAILLTHADNNIAALDFIKFLQNPTAKNIIEKYGYTIK